MKRPISVAEVLVSVPVILGVGVTCLFASCALLALFGGVFYFAAAFVRAPSPEVAMRVGTFAAGCCVVIGVAAILLGDAFRRTVPELKLPLDS